MPDLDVSLTGFEIPEIDLIIGEVVAKADPSDTLPPLRSTAVTKLGDLWILGDHRLYCGDARENAAYVALLGSKLASVVCIDPPYNAVIEGNVSGHGRNHHPEFAMASGEMSDQEFTEFLATCFCHLVRFSINGAVHFIAMDWHNVTELLDAAWRVYNSMLNLCVWNKDRGGLGSLYRSQHELFFVFRAGKKMHRNNIQFGKFGRNRTNVWNYPSASTLTKKGEDGNLLAMHPTVKPIAECALGKCRRLIICLPPRSLKSIMTSVAFVAWLLGNQPFAEIICASYGQDLADKHAFDTRKVMSSPGYQRAFPTRLSAQRRALSDFMTMDGGFRMATSVGGVLTGRGGDFLIIDDPLKPQDAFSESIRSSVNEWYDSTLLSRLNDKEKGVIIIVMQRLHQDDLVGHLTEREHWDVLRLPAIAEETESYRVNTWHGPVIFNRKAGEVLDPRRDSLETLEQWRSSIGNYLFEAQYQQNPQSPEGGLIKPSWLRYYTPQELPQNFSYKIQSWDTANKSRDLNDYSVCTTWGVYNKNYYLLDVFRDKLEYPELRRQVKVQEEKHHPSRIVIEDKSSGISLLQDLRRDIPGLTPYSPPAGNDKLMRLYVQSPVFEAGRVFLPKDAHWLGDYVREVTTFPGTKHDDQVDSTTQALAHLSSFSRCTWTIRELII